MTDKAEHRGWDPAADFHRHALDDPDFDFCNDREGASWVAFVVLSVAVVVAGVMVHNWRAIAWRASLYVAADDSGFKQSPACPAGHSCMWSTAVSFNGKGIDGFYYGGTWHDLTGKPVKPEDLGSPQSAGKTVN